MDLDLHYLKIFDAVAKYESYKQAAIELHISQPALSIQIKKLENQIGLKLFDKIGNRIVLNGNGVMLKSYTDKIFSIIEELENTILDTNQYVGGTLNIGGSNTPGTYILPSILGSFKELYPNTEFNVQIGNTNEILTAINNGTLDMAVNGGFCSYPGDISVENLFYDHLVLVAAPENYYASISLIQNKDLESMNFIVHQTDSQLYTYYLKFIEQAGIPEKVNMYLGNIDAIKKAVVSNLGITLIPYTAVKYEIESKLLTVLNYNITDLKYPYNLIYNKNKALTNTSQKFISYIKMYMEHCTSISSFS